jgi:DNA-binding GntR family transcriptional regulator
MPNTNANNLSQEIFEELSLRINSWNYAPSHRLTEQGLSKEFGVSRSPVREALGKLVDRGLVKKIPKIGYSVKQPNMTEVLELYDLRLALELYIVEWLSIHGMKKDEWSRLVEVWTNIDIDDDVEFYDVAKLDEEFHETLASAVGNSALIREHRGINERLHFLRMKDITTPERLLSTCEQHLEILRCIDSNDSSGARKALRLNVDSGRENVEAALKDVIAKAYLA